MIHFDPHEAGQLSRAQIQRHLPLLGQLSAAGDAAGDIRNHPLRGVGLTSYSADVRSAMRRDSMKYRDLLKTVRESSEKVAGVLQMDAPVSKNGYERLNRILQFYYELKDAEPALVDLLEGKHAQLEAYFNAEEMVREAEKRLLSVWKKEFLTQDIADFQAKMNASGKSFPGRASVISELQSYALQPLTADSIPGKLQQVLAFQTRKRRLIRMVQSLPDDDRKILAKLPTQEEYQAAAAAADEYRGRAESFPGGSAAVRSLSKNTDAVKALEEFRDAYPKALLAEQEFDNLLRRELCSDDDDWAEPETAFCQYLLDQPAALKDWGLY